MRVEIGALAIAALALNGCGGKSSGKATPSSSCSDQFLADYNAFADASNDYSEKARAAKETSASGAVRDAEKAALEKLVGACDRFEAHHKGVTCTAAAGESKSKWISSSSVSGKCAGNRAIWSARRADAPDLPPSVNRDGTCTPAFLTDYAIAATALKDLVDRTKRAQETQADADLKAMIQAVGPTVKACDSFERRHPAVSCQLSGGDGSVLTANTSDVKGACDQARELEKEIRAQGLGSISTLMTIGRAVETAIAPVKSAKDEK